VHFLLLALALAAPLPHDEAVADVWHLTRLLEQSHPDPFLRGGGRVAFYQAVDDVIRGLPEGAIEPADLRDHLLPIVARVGDGHTSLAPVAATTAPTALGLGLTPVDRTLVVTSVDHRDDRGLLGMAVVSVGGSSLDELLARQDRVVGSDNDMHRLVRLAKRLSTGEGRDAVVEGPLAVDLVSVTGERTTYTPDPSRKPAKQPVTMDSRWDLPQPGPHDIAWTLLDDGTAYLRIASMMRYREAFEIWRATGFDANLGDHLDRVAGAASKKLAADRDGRILQVPSATETFQELFAAMDREDVGSLVVDLRGNSGGNSALSLVLGLFLADGPTLRKAFADDGYQLRRFSELFHAAHTNAERPAGVPEGAYDFRVLHHSPSAEEQQEQLARYLGAMPTLKAAVDAGALRDGPPLRLKVLLDAGTYSAGFDLVRLLDALGAELVGVPSSQSGNCFIDSVPFHLQHSRLRGSMSTKWSVAYPDDPARGLLLPVDTALTWERWHELGFDPHAALTLAVDP